MQVVVTEDSGTMESEEQEGTVVAIHVGDLGMLAGAVHRWHSGRLGFIELFGNYVLYHTVPNQTIPYHIIPYDTIRYHTIPYHTVPTNIASDTIH